MLGLVTALLTAYYMTRQVIMVFFGEARWERRADEHGAHGDSSRTSRRGSCCSRSSCSPGCRIVGGAIQLPFTTTTKSLEHWLEPVVEVGERHIEGTAPTTSSALLVAGRHRRPRWPASSLALAGLHPKHGSRRSSRRSSPRAGTTTRRSARSWAAPAARCSTAIARFDADVIDGAVNGAASRAAIAGGQLRRRRPASCASTPRIIGVGVVLLLAWFVIVRGIL